MKFVIALILMFRPLAAQVTYSPQPINFGSVKLGQTSAVLSSTLTNTGTDTLRFTGGSSMAGSPAFQYVTDNCTARPPGGTCVLQYRFAPKTVGSLVGANVVQTNHGAFPLNFTGIGVDTATAPPAVTDRTCQTMPPPVGCGLRAGFWAALGITPVNGTFGPWFILDSLGRPKQVVRVIVRDTTVLGVMPVFRLDLGVAGDSSACQRDAPNALRCILSKP